MGWEKSNIRVIRSYLDEKTSANKFLTIMKNPLKMAAVCIIFLYNLKKEVHYAYNKPS